MKKKGFTLIELLAVIVILGVIALIATPLILNVVKQAREQAFLDSAYGIRDAAEYRYTEDMLTDITTEKKVYQYPDETNALKVKGEHPDAGKVIVERDGKIALALWSAKVGKCAVKNYEETKVHFDEEVTTPEDCALDGERTNQQEEVFDGWVRLTLYYPSNSTERMWRLGSEGEVRSDDTLNWEDYTGPITIPLSRVEDVWIKYKVNNETVVIPPSGRVLVNIEVSPTGTLTRRVTVNINYDASATTKEYRVGNSGWIPYTGSFEVSENVMIEARAIKDDSVYDASGNPVVTRTAMGRDYYYVGNIGVEEHDLPAPTIERISPVGDEVARVRITYPEGAAQKMYKLNYGIEETYSEEISITRYGTYVLAYYYDASGKRSQTKGIYINNTDPSSGGSGSWNPPSDVVINPPRGSGDPIPVEPIYQVPAPSIVVSPTTITNQVRVSVSVPSTADRIYLKLGSGNYQLYTGEVVVRENMSVSAYYITYQGERSDTGYGRVSNIRGTNGRGEALPYLRIDADPFPYPNATGARSVEVSLVSSDADTVEYSLNGIEYQSYTRPITITSNQRVYARASNAAGTTRTYLDITNIGTYTPPVSRDRLSVSIMAVPDPSVSTTKVDSVRVKITYDTRATRTYYSYGENGSLIEYTGEFEVTENTTIYAFAVSNNGLGQASKVIDHITSGIADPLITVVPSTQQASRVRVTIDYDQSATIKRYRIDGGSLRDYTGPFDLTDGRTIYAYSENARGESSSSTYQITNLITQPPIVVLDQGDYFLLKLNYPEGSSGREYKFMENGQWKSYKEDGILLIKSEYQNRVLDGDNVRIQIKNENGQMVTFRGDHYVLTVPVSQIFENIYMRWDRVQPPSPQILADTIEPAREVKITIVYDSSLVSKQYKVVDRDGNLITDWTRYNGAITVTDKNTIIYARGKDEAEVFTNESRYQVTNIDEEAPVINLVADYDNPTRQLGIKVTVTDDVKVNQVKWARGIQGASYFKTAGTVIPNDNIVTITENDYYTFYASDYAGNEQVYTVNINNIDLNPPAIEISVNPLNTVALNVTVSIDYGDATSKQYKIGNSTTWVNYTAPFNVDSYNVINNKLGNSDKTLTIYAKGKDSAGNEVIETYKVLSLDIDAPATPVINASAQYPTLTSYGVKFDSKTSITFDSRNDIRNYYSLDNGATWIEYTGEFELTAGTVRAKSVKGSTGLEVSSTKTVSLPSYAIGATAYDGNNATYTNQTNVYMKVDSSMEEKQISVLVYKEYSFASEDVCLNFLDKNKSLITRICTIQQKYTTDTIMTIPKETRWIMIENKSTSRSKLYELTPATEPTFTAENGYMLLHADLTKSIKRPYQRIMIDYFPTNVRRFYRIGTTGEWKEYQDKAIQVEQGQTIYAKGIDQYGNQTRIISSYTANVTDALGVEAYDGNNATYTNQTNVYVKVDSSMEGKQISVLVYKEYSFGSEDICLNFSDKNKNVITRICTIQQKYTTNTIMTIPKETRWIMIENKNTSRSKLYELTPILT